MNRRIIIIVLGVLILAGVGLLAYMLLRTGGGDTDTAGNLPEIGGNFADLTPNTSELASSTIQLDPVAAYRAFPDGSVVAIHRDGKISRLSGSTVTALSSTPVADFASASFSADGSKVLVLTGQQPRSSVNIFDVATASWRIIPGTFRDATWGPRGLQLATLTPDEKTGKTVVGIYDVALGRTSATLATLSLGDVSVSWPAPGTVIVQDKPNARSTGSAWAIDVASKRITLAARGRQGFTSIWDGTGTAGLALESRNYGRGGTVSLYTGGVPSARMAFVTVPEKCTFASLPGAGSSTIPYVVCAVPRDQNGFLRFELPDSWLRREVFTDDVIVGVNLNSRTVDFTLAPPLVVDATRLQVVGNTVYYADRVTDRVYRSDI